MTDASGRAVDQFSPFISKNCIFSSALPPSFATGDESRRQHRLEQSPVPLRRHRRHRRADPIVDISFASSLSPTRCCLANSTRSDHEYGLPNVSLPPLPSFDAFPSLPFFKSSNNSSLFKYPPFAAHPLSKSRRRSRYSTHNCMGGQDLPGLNFDDQTTCEFKDVCVSLLPLWSEKELAEMNETERRVATTLRLEYFRPEGVGDDVPIQWNNEFPVGELDVLSSEAERAGRSWTRLDRDSAVIPVIVKGEIPPNERWSDAKIAVLTEAFYPENFGQYVFPPPVSDDVGADRWETVRWEMISSPFIDSFDISTRPGPPFVDRCKSSSIQAASEEPGKSEDGKSFPFVPISQN